LHERQVRHACLPQFPHRRFLVVLLCGLENARHVAAWRVQEAGKKRKKLAALLTRSRLEKWTEQALSPVKGLDVFFCHLENEVLMSKFALRKRFAVFRLDCTYCRDSLEEFEEKRTRQTTSRKVVSEGSPP
jgi:hypothetical protein